MGVKLEKLLSSRNFPPLKAAENVRDLPRQRGVTPMGSHARRAAEVADIFIPLTRNENSAMTVEGGGGATVEGGGGATVEGGGGGRDFRFYSKNSMPYAFGGSGASGPTILRASGRPAEIG